MTSHVIVNRFVIFQEYDVCQYLSRVLYECVSHEKPEILSTHMAMQQVCVRVYTSVQVCFIFVMKSKSVDGNLHSSHCYHN